MIKLAQQLVVSHGFDSGSGRFCVEFACSPCLCVSFLRGLRLPPTVPKHANWAFITDLT